MFFLLFLRSICCIELPSRIKLLLMPYSSTALELCKFDSPEGQHVYWHSSAHILGQALEMKYGAHLCVGPAIEEGFYYDVYMGDQKVSEDDFKGTPQPCYLLPALNWKQTLRRL